MTLAPPPSAVPPPPRWRRLTLYGVFTAFAFVVSLYATFPYDAVKERLVAETAQQGIHLRIASLGPGFFGVTASGVEVMRKVLDDEETPPPALRLDSLTLRPSLFPLGVGFSGRAYGATFGGAVGGRKELTVRAGLNGMDFSHVGFSTLTGIQAMGKLDADISLAMPMLQMPGQDPMPQLNRATGQVEISGDRLEVRGGTLTGSMPLDLPAAKLGDLDVALKFDGGAGTVERLALKGGEVEVNGSGTVKLERELPLTVLGIELRVKVVPELQKRLGLIGAGLTLLPADRADPEWRIARLNGLAGQLGRMQQPGMPR